MTAKLVLFVQPLCNYKLQRHYSYLYNRCKKYSETRLICTTLVRCITAALVFSGTCLFAQPSTVVQITATLALIVNFVQPLYNKCSVKLHWHLSSTVVQMTCLIQPAVPSPSPLRILSSLYKLQRHTSYLHNRCINYSSTRLICTTVV
jgi:hypothetical protein